ncbi:zinc finger protein 414-like isoform X1, partial [Tachysurus ichikawai]
DLPAPILHRWNSPQALSREEAQSFNSRILWEHTRGRYSCLQCGHSTPERKEMTAHIEGHHRSPWAKTNDTGVLKPNPLGAHEAPFKPHPLSSHKAPFKPHPFSFHETPFKPHPFSSHKAPFKPHPFSFHETPFKPHPLGSHKAPFKSRPLLFS